MPVKHVCIGSDHRGYDLKLALLNRLNLDAVPNLDLGCFGHDPCDYPDIVTELSRNLVDIGVLICNTGIGMTIAANKKPNLYAAMCINTDIAASARAHNHANTLVLSAKYTDTNAAIDIMTAFINSEFTMETRHLNRLRKIGSN